MINLEDFRKILLYFTLPAVIFVLSWIFLFTGVYGYYTWFDIPMHIIGGASVAFTYFLVFRFLQTKNLLILPKMARVVFVVSLVALTAVLWEFFEFSATIITGYSLQGNLEDTMFDLFNGILGGVVGVLFYEIVNSKIYLKSK